MSRAFIFPGQGSQAVGMGAALGQSHAAARAVFAEVDEALGQSLSRLMFEGPAEELTLTANAQPALMAASLAVLRVLEAERGLDLARDVAFVAGHSLGEYSALAAAGALSVADTARLLRLRGEAMQRAVPVGTGAMAALLGLPIETVEEIAGEAEQGEVCDVANDNGAGQVVVSGHVAAVERAVALAQARGAKRAVMLNVSAPFHCRLMSPAAETMRAALDQVQLGAAKVPVVANILAAPIREPAAIRDALVRQVTGTVRWRECVAAMAASGVDAFCEVGSGKVLTGLVKRIAPGAGAVAIGAPADIDAFTL
ncbi:malonyl CoA-acyl carrier protein transacylase [Methylobacterium sp. 4-46]|uniref:ACP S-malonyltransferase n=1 Tax=unclassified Methylobacterium TaxID=2615210 RepID=UPI000152C13D|nr:MULTISPECIES: ACP S-malonyltransferase [Methylobacterium]ACA17606.1 malonyl CoA-acyl carrier protein transacylase [Methylobacterium sp. 4-46]WFT83281.1 ACP S-malonyltransferase [Methylobacterium nodulans]